MAASRSDHLRQHWARIQAIQGQGHYNIQHPHEYNGTVGYISGQGNSPQNQSSPSRLRPEQRPVNAVSPRNSGHWNQNPLSPLRRSEIYTDQPHSSEDCGSELADSWRPVKLKPSPIDKQQGNGKAVRNSGHWSTRSQEMLAQQERQSPYNPSYNEQSEAESPVRHVAFNYSATNLPGFNTGAPSDDDASSPNYYEDDKNEQIEERQKLNDQSNNKGKDRKEKHANDVNKKRRKASVVSSDDDFEYHSTSEPIGDGSSENKRREIQRRRRRRKVSQEELLDFQYPYQGKILIYMLTTLCLKILCK